MMKYLKIAFCNLISWTSVLISNQLVKLYRNGVTELQLYAKKKGKNAKCFVYVRLSEVPYKPSDNRNIVVLINTYCNFAGDTKLISKLRKFQ